MSGRREELRAELTTGAERAPDGVFGRIVAAGPGAVERTVDAWLTTESAYALKAWGDGVDLRRWHDPEVRAAVYAARAAVDRAARLMGASAWDEVDR